MKNHIFNVGKTATGFDAYYQEKDKILVVTTGTNITELKRNIIEAYNLHAEVNGKASITVDDITLKYDISSFFEFYKEINASALGNRIGMNKSLISDYVNGRRTPSDKQTIKILNGIKQLGKELTELELS
jgi:transcriptional regulator with XRE-family HTH domain